MVYGEQQIGGRSVVDIPPSRREAVVQTEQRYEGRRSGMSTAMELILTVALVPIVALLMAFFMAKATDDSNIDEVATQQLPAAQQPVIVQQPAPASQPAPVVINSGSIKEAAAQNDLIIQSMMVDRLAQDATLSTLGVKALVQEGKVRLMGTVRTANLKQQVETLVWTVKGVKAIDNQIVVGAA